MLKTTLSDDRAKGKAEAESIAASSKDEIAKVTAIKRAETRLAVQKLGQRAATRGLKDQIRQQENLEAIATAAIAVLEQSNQDISEEPVNEDFIYRFFDECKNISDEQMQMVWGRLLAGEIAQPGSYHPKTLTILKDLTKEDAEFFVNLCRFIVDIDGIEAIIFNNGGDDVYINAGLKFGILLHLQHLGLLAIDTFTHFAKGSISTMTYRSKRFAVTTKATRIDSGSVSLTEAGIQLSHLVDALVVPEFWDYAVQHWKARGVIVTPIDEDEIAASSISK